MSPTGSYLYAVCRPLDAEAAAVLAGVPGVAGGAVRVLVDESRRETACVVSSVDLAEFGEVPLRAHLGDIGWVERVAREHDAVVRAAAALTTTAPLRMATICRDDAAARARLDALGDSAAALLNRLAGRVEWGVKAFAAEPSRAGASVAAAGSGADYLRQRRDELAGRERTAEEGARHATDVYDRLAGAAAAGCRHRPQDARLSGVSEPMLLNAAFLVDRVRSDEFAAALSALREQFRDLRLELTGPWPPYSFAVLDEEP